MLNVSAVIPVSINVNERTTQADQYMSTFIEDIKRDHQTYIEMDLFRKIAFKSGMPLILVDLFGYLTGQPKLIAKAMNLLNERPPPLRVGKKGKKSRSRQESIVP